MLDLRSVWSRSQLLAEWVPGWLLGLLILAAAAVAAVLAHLALLATLRRIVGADGFLAALVERTSAATPLALIGFVTSAALQGAPFEPPGRGPLGPGPLVCVM